MRSSALGRSGRAGKSGNEAASGSVPSMALREALVAIQVVLVLVITGVARLFDRSLRSSARVRVMTPLFVFRRYPKKVPVLGYPGGAVVTLVGFGTGALIK